MNKPPTIRPATHALAAIKHHHTSWTGSQLLIAATARFERTAGPATDHPVDQAIDHLVALAEIAGAPGRSPALPTTTWILTGLEALIRRADHDPDWKPLTPAGQ